MTSKDELHPRLAFDLRARQQVFGDSDSIDVAEGAEEFWGWYASTIRCGKHFRLAQRKDVPPYPLSSGRVAFWYSGGVESTYTREQISHLNPTILRIEDFSLFKSVHRKLGQIHFLCAAIASSLGFSEIYVGAERNDLLMGNDTFSRSYLERSPLFTEAWSRYQPEHRLLTVCGHLHKEQIISWLHERRIKITGTCDKFRDGQWCGDCYKCFEAFYSAKAVGVDLGMVLTREAFDRYYAEFRRFVESDFRDNFNNAYQHYVRLQILYGLEFDAASDCRGPHNERAKCHEY